MLGSRRNQDPERKRQRSKLSNISGCGRTLEVDVVGHWNKIIPVMIHTRSLLLPEIQQLKIEILLQNLVSSCTLSAEKDLSLCLSFGPFLGLPPPAEMRPELSTGSLSFQNKLAIITVGSYYLLAAGGRSLGLAPHAGKLFTTRLSTPLHYFKRQAIIVPLSFKQRTCLGNGIATSSITHSCWLQPINTKVRQHQDPHLTRNRLARFRYRSLSPPSTLSLR